MSNIEDNQWSLNEFFPDLPEVPSLIFDYSIVYIGVPAFFEQQEGEYRIAADIQSKLDGLYATALPVHQATLYKALYDTKKLVAQTNSLKAQYALQFLECIHRVFSPLHSEQESERFLHLIQKRQLIDQITNNMSDELSLYVHQMRSFFSPYQNSTTWYRIDPRNT